MDWKYSWRDYKRGVRMKKIEISGDGIHGVIVAKRINELIDHVEELEAKAREEHKLPSMDELLERAYQKGREDKYQEITANCMLLTEEQVKDIRNDAIDEFLEMLKNPFTIDSILAAHDKFTLYAIFKRVAEQLKDGKHE